MAVRTRVALALGSGGARGYAHIGVIQVLVERGYDIVSIAGTSMGAVVGGLHAAGRLDPYTDWVRGLSQRDVLRLLDPSLKAPGVIRAEKVLAKVTELLDGALIEDLPIPFTAVATDLLARKEVWFQRGPADMAMRASMAIPSVITPVVINGRLLADGGLMDPVPVAATAPSHADVTVAVALSGVRESAAGSAPAQETAEQRPMEEWRERFRRTYTQVLRGDIARALPARLRESWATTAAVGDAGEAAASEAVIGEVFGALPEGLGMVDVMSLSLDALQDVVTRYRLAGYPPDLVISVPKSSCRTLDFHKAGEMIELGRRLTEEALDRDAAFPAPRAGDML